MSLTQILEFNWKSFKIYLPELNTRVLEISEDSISIFSAAICILLLELNNLMYEEYIKTEKIRS